jgi:3-oxoadipate enol-lactonase
MADYAADADALLQAVGWDRCMVIGVSFGGMVAQEFAIRYQHRVEKLVLCCTSSGGAGGASYPLHEVKGLSLEEYARLVITLADNRRDAAWQAAYQQEFQTLLKDTLNGLQIGADEPGRAMGTSPNNEARKDHGTYSACQPCRCPGFSHLRGRSPLMASPPSTNQEAMEAKQI